MSIVEIGVWQLAAAYLLLAFPLAIMLWYRIPMIGDTAVALVRMTVQLIFVGLYLQVIFQLNILWLSAAWLLVMVMVADVSIVRSCSLRLRPIVLPLFVALAAGTTIPLLLFVGLILRRPNLMDAQYAIPIGGMILGNCLRADIVGIRTFYEGIRTGEKAFLQSLAQGALLHGGDHDHHRPGLPARHDDRRHPRRSQSRHRHQVPDRHHDLHLLRNRHHTGPRHLPHHQAKLHPLRPPRPSHLPQPVQEIVRLA